MKITVQNFKAIRNLQEFEFKPCTILSGVNSSGKSSFIQLLLLLKQTIELNSSNIPFFLKGEYYQVQSFTDILFEKKSENRLNVTFEFKKDELINSSDDLNIIGSYDYICNISIEFGLLNNEVKVTKFEVNILLPENTIKDLFLRINYNEDSNAYFIESNSEMFGEEVWGTKPINANLAFLSFYPLYFQDLNEPVLKKELIKVDWVVNSINSFLQNIHYIGPIREQPQDEYVIRDVKKNVGSKGEFVAKILEEHGNEIVYSFHVSLLEDGIKYEFEEYSLIESVKYWMCKIFEVADDVFPEKDRDVYKINLISKSGIASSIKHVGFGISQILPIVVEGLIMPKGATLILEQPEIHLHPRLQSLLFDFLYGLVLQGKSIIIETHSNHIITRMRRRIAEDISNDMERNIGLTFIEGEFFRNIGLDDYGTLGYFPEGFIEQSSLELKAIVKAQMKKRQKG